MRATLFSRLTPEAREKYEQERENYGPAIEAIYESLKNNTTWQDLTLTEVHRVLLYSNHFDTRYDYIKLMYGDENIIKPENDLI
jgi:hypothetical protein